MDAYCSLVQRVQELSYRSSLTLGLWRQVALPLSWRISIPMAWTISHLMLLVSNIAATSSTQCTVYTFLE
jgi:hypothetical protein